jgi:cyclic pyranopterin phosphate synthase
MHSDIKDRYNRKFKNLRVSLTSACNFACHYCVAENSKLQKLSNELNPDELEKLVLLLHKALEIKKIRLTGGEPLLAKSFLPALNFVSLLKDTEISLTTNAQLIHKFKKEILSSNIKRINVSLDSLDETGFKKLAKSGDLQTVLKNIDWLLENDISVKINMVPMKGMNDDQFIKMLDYCLEKNIELRYIELMKMGHLYQNNEFNKYFVSMFDVLDKIKEKYNFEELPKTPNSTSQHFKTKKGIFAFIPNESKPFCQDCDRLRLSSDGRLFGCISNDKNNSIRHLLKLNELDALKELKKILNLTIQHKQSFFSGQAIPMKSLGG